MLDGELSKKNTDDWLELFAGQVPAARIHDIQSALDNPFVTDEGRLQSLDLEGYGTYQAIDAPVKCDEPTPAKPAPTLGQDTDDLLEELGYDADRLATLRAAKAI